MIRIPSSSSCKEETSQKQGASTERLGCERPAARLTTCSFPLSSDELSTSRSISMVSGSCSTALPFPFRPAADSVVADVSTGIVPFGSDILQPRVESWVGTDFGELSEEAGNFLRKGARICTKFVLESKSDSRNSGKILNELCIERVHSNCFGWECGGDVRVRVN